MVRTSFPAGVRDKLGFYVYRLIDPRNGETFYVGKGQGDRVFKHANGAIRPAIEVDILDIKLQRIRDIRASGLEVGHVLHRHGIQDADTAFQIEASLIDAYPGLLNRVGGHKNDFGVVHVEEVTALYGAEPLVPAHPLLLISIGNSFYEEGLSVYDAVR